MVPWTMTGASGDWSAVYEIDGKQVINGEDGYTSKELLENLPLAMSNDENVAALREKFGARIIG